MKIFVGPANYAGQADALAIALRQAGHHATSAGLLSPRGRTAFNSDLSVGPIRWGLDPAWKRKARRFLRDEMDAVVLDGGLPWAHGRATINHRGRLAFGRGGLAPELEWLQHAGVTASLLFHGTEIRDPQRHADTEPLSPYRTMDRRLRSRAQRMSASLREVATQTGAPAFVTTPDLLLDLPGSTWVPLAVPHSPWSLAAAPTFTRPRVVHAPSNQVFSGTSDIDAVLRRLDAEGVISYTVASGLSRQAMIELVTGADIVVDKVSIGSYGVTAVEAMHAGRVVVGHANQATRQLVRDHTDAELPIVDATPDTIEHVIREIIAEPERSMEISTRGTAFARRWHAGQASVDVLVGGLTQVVQ